MAEYTAYFNGDWVPWEQVKIDPMDKGFLVADCVYDAGRTFDGKIYRLKDHIDRLYRSLKFIRLDPGLTPEEMTDITEEAIQRNEHLRADVGDHSWRQWVTRGPGRWTRDAGPPTVIVRVSPMGFNQYAHLYETGVHGVIARTRSYVTGTVEPKLKHQSRLNFSMADLEVNDVDPLAWPIITDMDGNITEGTQYNVALVTNGVIRTPTDHSILQGVSQVVVRELAERLDIPCVEEDLQPYDLYTADEVFFAASSMCVLPVTKVDFRQVADGKPGPITQQLLAAWSETVGVDIVGQALRYSDGYPGLGVG